MAKKPAYREWKTRNRGYCNAPDGRKYFPGEYGSIESLEAYEAFCASVNGVPVKPTAATITVAEVCLAYLQYAQELHAGPKLYAKTGYKRPKIVTRHIIDAGFGDMRAIEFGPKSMKKVVKHMEDSGKAQSTIKALLGWGKRIFEWAVSEEMIPPSVFQSLATVKPPRNGHTKAAPPKKRKPAQWPDVEAALPFMPQTVADMVRFQWLCGARSGTICEARPEEFTTDPTDPALLIWEPSRHKTAYMGKQLKIVLGPQAQAVLRPYLQNRGYCFKKSADRRMTREHYTVYRYYLTCRQAQEHAAVAAKESKLPAPGIWFPHMLRHARGQAVRDRFSLEHQQAAIGWDNISAAQVYSARSMALAEEVARAMG